MCKADTRMVYLYEICSDNYRKDKVQDKVGKVNT